jgi:hypothetical protein
MAKTSAVASGKFGFGYPAIAAGSSQTSHYSHYPAWTFDLGISPISPISLFAPSALLQDNTRVRNPQRPVPISCQKIVAVVT